MSTAGADVARSKKPEIIEFLFNERWDEQTSTLSRPVVTLEDIVQAIRRSNERNRDDPPISDRNPANFFKDYIRKRSSANANWPPGLLAHGYTARQRTGNNECFEFVPMAPGQTEPFPNLLPQPTRGTLEYRIESVSLPLASRRLGRTDEPWLVQVLVRLRVIETHLSLVSQRNFVQIDHLQMSVKLRKSEIDALFLAIEEMEPDGKMTREVIVCCEAKGLRDDILLEQVLRQAKEVFDIPGVTQDLMLPIAIKAIGRSRVHVYEFDVVTREQVPQLTSLSLVSDAVYELTPHVPGIGQ